jgi:hypothetical protein
MRRYGVWAGNREGRAEDPALCIESVMPARSFRSHQCQRKRGFGPDGQYCKQHDPAFIKARDEKRSAEYNKEVAARNQRYDDADVGTQLRKTNPELYQRILEAL